jgi:hypothetical protein
VASEGVKTSFFKNLNKIELLEATILIVRSQNFSRKRAKGYITLLLMWKIS